MPRTVVEHPVRSGYTLRSQPKPADHRRVDALRVEVPAQQTVAFNVDRAEVHR
jgi:hypothetical protein